MWLSLYAIGCDRHPVFDKDLLAVVKAVNSRKRPPNPYLSTLLG